MVLLKSKVFWGLVCQLVALVSNTYFPQVPLSADILLIVVGVVLAAFGIHPELKGRGLL